jgi:hypothetical protein
MDFFYPRYGWKKILKEVIEEIKKYKIKWDFFGE